MKQKKKYELNWLTILGKNKAAILAFLFAFGLFEAQSGIVSGLYNSASNKPSKEAYKTTRNATAALGLIPLMIAIYMVTVAVRKGRKTEDIMNGLKTFDVYYDLDASNLKNMLDVDIMGTTLNVISKLSAKHPEYFDLLIDDKIPTKDKKLYFRLACGILSGYLKSHPKEERLVVDVFTKKFKTYLQVQSYNDEVNFAKEAFEPLDNEKIDNVLQQYQRPSYIYVKMMQNERK